MIFGIGIDLIEIDRIETIFKKWGNDFARKILSKQELFFFSNFVDPDVSSKAILYLAKRFTAKEAECCCIPPITKGEIPSLKNANLI